MSALDAVIKAGARERWTTEDERKAAREELELLRDAEKIAWEWAGWTSTDKDGTRDRLCWQCGLNVGTLKHDEDCFALRILRTDPDRARKMGLGWAL